MRVSGACGNSIGGYDLRESRVEERSEVSESLDITLLGGTQKPLSHIERTYSSRVLMHARDVGLFPHRQAWMSEVGSKKRHVQIFHNVVMLQLYPMDI